MASQPSPSPEPRVPLSRERVLRAAIEIADEGGIESLSMRKLADVLGVKAMSLYNHVANKDDVLDGIVDAVAAEIGSPSAGADWKTAIRELSVSAHETLLRHPWAGTLWMTRPTLSPARLRYGDSLLGSLEAGGLSEDLTYHAYHIIESQVLGYTLQVLNYRALDTDRLADAAVRFLEEAAGEYPHFTEHVHQHLEGGHDDVSALELGLDLILDALERLRDAG